MTDPHNRESYQMVEDGRCPSSGAALPPFGLSPASGSQAKPAATNADSFLRDFLAFCRSKPSGEKYEPASAGACALAQFGYPYVATSNRAEKGVPEEAYDAATSHANGWRDTFGALAERLAQAIEARRSAEGPTNCPVCLLLLDDDYCHQCERNIGSQGRCA